MNKVTTCCKATYKEIHNEFGTMYGCEQCKFICTLEDIPDMRTKVYIDNKICEELPVHTESMDDRLDHLEESGDIKFYSRKDFNLIKSFIKSELERRDRELIEKIQAYRETRINEDSLETIDDILDLIKNK